MRSSLWRSLLRFLPKPIMSCGTLWTLSIIVCMLGRATCEKVTDPSVHHDQMMMSFMAQYTLLTGRQKLTSNDAGWWWVPQPFEVYEMASPFLVRVFSSRVTSRVTRWWVRYDIKTKVGLGLRLMWLILTLDILFVRSLCSGAPEKEDVIWPQTFNVLSTDGSLLGGNEAYIMADLLSMFPTGLCTFYVLTTIPIKRLQAS